MAKHYQFVLSKTLGIKIFFFAAILSVSTGSAKATPCQSGVSEASLSGVTCSIGSLQFTFGAPSQFDSNGIPIALTFTTTTNGFTLSSTNGPFTLTNPTILDPIWAYTNLDQASLPYSVTDTAGNLTALEVSNLGTYSSTSGTAGSGGDFSACNGYCEAELEIFSYQGTPYFFTNAPDPLPVPISSTNGTAYISLNASTNNGAPGAATAIFDSTTFTFDTTNSTSVTPEPSSIFLFGTGLLAMAKAIRRKVSA